MPVKYDYGDLALASMSLVESVMLTLLESIRKSQIVTRPDGNQFKVENNAESHFLYSKVNHGFLNH
jgi:hypothetical protein